MTKVVIYTKDDLEKIIRKVASPQVYLVVTDEATSIYLLPKKTSRNRYIYQYTPTHKKAEKEIREIVDLAIDLGYDVVVGHVQEFQT